MSHVCTHRLHSVAAGDACAAAWAALAMASETPLFSLLYKRNTLCSLHGTCIKPDVARSSRRVVQVALYCHPPRLRKGSVAAALAGG
jgi:hypothetical protein